MIKNKPMIKAFHLIGGILSDEIANTNESQHGKINHVCEGTLTQDHSQNETVVTN